MLSTAVQELKAHKSQIAAQVKALAQEAKQIERAIKALLGISTGGTTTTATAPTTAKKRRKMSPLGKLKIKLGSLKRYKKTEEAKKLQAKIDAFTAKK